MFPLDLPISLQDASVAFLFVAAIGLVVRRRLARKAESAGTCRACGVANGITDLPVPQESRSQHII